MWISEEKFNALKTKAENYDKIITALVAKSKDVKAEEITSDMIVEAIKEADNVDVTAIQQQLDTVTTERDTAQARVTELEKEVEDFKLDNKALKKVPSEPTAETKREGDANATAETIEAFADAHAGDTYAILGKLQEEGLLPKN